jgi:hypothetical protein
MSRREFARLGSAAALGVGFASRNVAAQAGQQSAAAAQPPRAPIPPPDALKSEFLMDLVLETAPAISFGARTAVAVTGGTFTGPKLKGKVVGPGADWPVTINPSLRVLDVRTILVTDDDQRIYCTYRGVISTPQDPQATRYWRSVPIFETDSKKYEWLTQAVFVGVSYTVPQRVAYRIFQIL